MLRAEAVLVKDHQKRMQEEFGALLDADRQEGELSTIQVDPNLLKLKTIIRSQILPGCGSFYTEWKA